MTPPRTECLWTTFSGATLMTAKKNCCYCEQGCEEWCEECGGCPECCDNEYHCIHCGNSMLICTCEDREFKTKDGSPLD